MDIRKWVEHALITGLALLTFIAMKVAFVGLVIVIWRLCCA